MPSDVLEFAAIDEVKVRLAASIGAVDSTDDVRLTSADDWWLLRASKTKDLLVARAESNSQREPNRLLPEVVSFWL